jgi:hypothetical protein
MKKGEQHRIHLMNSLRGHQVDDTDPTDILRHDGEDVLRFLKVVLELQRKNKQI